MKETFTREQVVKVIDELLQYPLVVMDAMNNENTDEDAESLLEMVEATIQL